MGNKFIPYSRSCLDGSLEDTYGQYGKRGDGNNNVKCIIFWKKKKNFLYFGGGSEWAGKCCGTAGSDD